MLTSSCFSGPCSIIHVVRQGGVYFRYPAGVIRRVPWHADACLPQAGDKLVEHSTFGLGHLLMVTEPTSYEPPADQKSWFLGMLTPSCPRQAQKCACPRQKTSCREAFSGPN